MPAGTRPTPVDRTARLSFNGTHGNNPFANVMWLFLGGSTSITQADIESIASQASSAYSTHLLGILSNEVTLVSTEVILYTGGDAMVGFNGDSHFGGAAAPTLPSNVSFCISWKIAPHYKGGHPRTYLPGIPVAWMQDPSSFTSAVVTAATDHANSFHTALESIPPMGSRVTSVAHGTVSFVRNKAWRTPPVFYRFTGATADNRIDTQRRRLGRDRPN